MLEDYFLFGARLIFRGYVKLPGSKALGKHHIHSPKQQISFNHMFCRQNLTQKAWSSEIQEELYWNEPGRTCSEATVKVTTPC